MKGTKLRKILIAAVVLVIAFICLIIYINRPASILEMCTREEIIAEAKTAYCEGGGTYIHKQTKPLTYQIIGDYDMGDEKTIADMYEYLSEIDGYPGVTKAEEGKLGDIIFFYSSPEKVEEDYEIGTGDLPAVYSLNAEKAVISGGFVWVDSTRDFEIREKYVSSCIVRLTGLFESHRNDSLVYKDGELLVAIPSDLDRYMLRMLYSKYAEAGMGSADLETIVDRCLANLK